MPALKGPAFLLALLLTSCVTSRTVAPTNSRELTRLVLFIEKQSDGTVTHAWKRAEAFDLSPYRGARTTRPAFPVVLTTGGTRDCDEENRACIHECMSRPLPQGYGHITSGGRGRGGKEVYCNEKCMQPYRDCLKVQQLQPREFTSVDKAIDWLKQNRDSVLLGGVVIVAGVAFVTVSAGVGVLILVPAVLLATPSTAADPILAEASP
jgi:hypothetical protein